MYIGHASVALVIKARRPEVPLLPLLFAAYGPDWIDVALMIPHPREGMSPYSHSIPALILGAIVAAILYEATARRPGASRIAMVWLLHYPADLITGLKPILGVSPAIGLDAYHLPPVDFVIEALVMSYACIEYGRAFADTPNKRSVLKLMWGAMLVLQATLNVAMHQLDPAPWSPSLAAGTWRPHVMSSMSLGAKSGLHGSCTTRPHSQGSEQCRRREHRGLSRWFV